MTTATILDDGYMPRPPLTLDQYRRRCGEELGRSHWITVDQPTIDAFAALTGDHQAIHLDRERAIAAGYPSTIAHGFLTLSLIGGLGPRTIPPLRDSATALNYGFDRVRLVAPVPSGSRIRAVFRLRHVDVRRADQVRLVVETTVQIEGAARPAAIAEWVLLFVLHEGGNERMPDGPASRVAGAVSG